MAEMILITIASTNEATPPTVDYSLQIKVKNDSDVCCFWIAPECWPEIFGINIRLKYPKFKRNPGCAKRPRLSWSFRSTVGHNVLPINVPYRQMNQTIHQPIQSQNIMLIQVVQISAVFFLIYP